VLRRLTARLLVALIAFGVAFSGDALAQGQQGPRTFSTPVGLELVADGFTSPVALVESPDGTGRRFVVDQVGLVWIITASGEVLKTPFLDVRDRMVQLNPRYDERGLLGLAFHPRYHDTGRLFVYYSAPLRAEAPDDFNHTAYLSEFRVSAGDPNRADPATERRLLTVDQPQANHNGGTLAFGPADGYLYLSLGDGGGRDDVGVGHVDDWYDRNTGGNAQDVTQNLLGSILRIDIDQGNPYAIPSDNPFVNGSGLPEQWAFGFRNPYRFSFDMGGDHALFVGDAGQEQWEEVDIVVRGGNYGWNIREGAHCFDVANPKSSPATCPETDPWGNPLIGPVIEFLNSNMPGGVGNVVVGGYVYRGSRLPQLGASYIFGTWGRGTFQGGLEGGALFIAGPCESGRCDFSRLWLDDMPGGVLDDFLLSFGQDRFGEIYVLTTSELGPSGSGGKVYKIVKAD
jgi:glucose/arabinose dehydrogenase